MEPSGHPKEEETPELIVRKDDKTPELITSKEDKTLELITSKEDKTPELIPSKEDLRIPPVEDDYREEEDTASEGEHDLAIRPQKISVENLKLEIADPHRPEADDGKDVETIPEDEKETEKPLMEDKVLEDRESITIEIDEEKLKDVTDKAKQSKFSIHVFPITRLKVAWNQSSNICEFVLKAVFIIFSTLGWLFCVGGIPFVSIALLVMGSIYKDDCKMQPNIPVYLIVAGVLGTLQHFIAVWTRYIPKDSIGRVRIYRAYCRVFDGILQLFLIIWFVMGCIWVYGAYSTVNFEEEYKDEYCDKALYLFAFWILNLSFAVLAILVVMSLLVILCIVVIDKD